MNLLTLTTSYPTDVDPFRGPFIERWAHHMQVLGASVHVIGPAAKKPIGSCQYTGFRDIGGSLRGSGVPDEMQTKPVWGSVRGAAITLEMVKTTRRLISKADALVCHWLLPSVYAGLASAMGTGVPVHGYAHGGDIALIESMPRSIAKRICQVADRQCHSLIFVSENLQSRFNRLLERPSKAQQHVIPMGIEPALPDLDFRRWLKAQARGRPIITTLGRHVKIKGLDLVFKALREETDILWVAAGDGPYREQLDQYAKKSPLDILLPGQITPSQRDALFEETAVFVQFSRQLGTRSEGHPVALIEALSAGVPSIVSRSGGMPAIAEKAGCLMVEEGDGDALKRAILKLLDDAKARQTMAKRHRLYAQNGHWETLAPIHFRAILGEPRVD